LNSHIPENWFLSAVVATVLCAAAMTTIMTTTSCGSDTAPPASVTGGTGGAADSNLAGHAAGNAANGGGAGGAGGSGRPAATFTAIYEMMFPMATNARCNACHANPANDVGNGKLQMGMDKTSAYAAVVGQTSMSSRCMNKPLVVPFQPDMSLFYQKLLPTPPCGTRMPNGGTAFSSEQLEMVRSWIAAGAKDD
jgi:hypothetical protein